MERTHGVTHYDPDECYGCKLLTVQFGVPTFVPHYNFSVGKYVTSWSDFNDALKKASDVQSEYTGIAHAYEPLHPSDLINNVPPETAPSHLQSLSNIDDPTLKESMKRLEREREAARQEAERSLTEDIIHDPQRDSIPDLMPANAV